MKPSSHPLAASSSKAVLRKVIAPEAEVEL